MSSISNRNMMSGLVSGLDTEQLVKAMTMNTKNRINSQKQKLQTLQWKQESYRDVISKISDFKNKYLDILSDTSIKANKVLKKYSATSSNDKVITATASAGATPAKYTIREAHAAKGASVSSAGSISTGEVMLDFSNAVSGRSYTVEMELDGVKKNVTFKAGTNTERSKENFLAAANAVFSEVKGSGKQFEFTDGTSNLKFNGNDGVFHTFSVGYNAQGVGLKNTTSNKIYASTSIDKVGFNQALQETDDGKYSFNINGVDFEFEKDTTITNIVNTVNNSKAGVKLSFSNISQGFTLESTVTGDAAEINMYQTKGNLLNAMFNLDSDKLKPTNADTAELTYVGKVKVEGNLSSTVTDRFDKPFDLADGPLFANVKVTDNDGNTVDVTMNIGNELKNMSPAGADGNYTDMQVEVAFNTAFYSAYGSINGTGTDDGIFKYSNGTLTIDSPDRIIEFENSFTKGDKALTNAKTLNADSSYIPAEGVKTMTFERNGEEVVVNGKGGMDINLQDLIEAKIIMLPSDGNVIAAGNITAKDDAAKDFLNKVFGKESLVGADDNDIMTARGSNSILEISSDGENFTKYSSASNLFTFDGTTINLSNAKDFAAETEEDYITVETAKDNSEIKDVIKSFVNDYNQMLENLYKITSTARPKSSGSYYDPLTEEQEEEMSDKEIERWNENAKQGLLYRDNNVLKFLSEIRGAMLTRVDGMGLNDLGIAGKSWLVDGKISLDQMNGQLAIDESKLDSMLEAHGDQIAELFTGKDGLAAKLENVIDKAISTSKSTTTDSTGKRVTKGYGYLSSMAGIEGTRTDKDNLIYKQMEYINNIIDKLNTKYENEQERYWKQYSRLETMMAKMQSTMSYFEQ